MSSDTAPVRYTVCLIATTRGSSALERMKSSTGANDWNGWCSRTSCRAMVSNWSSSPASRAAGTDGVNAGYLRSGRSISVSTSRRRYRFTGPSVW